jgi:hypothetical protein
MSKIPYYNFPEWLGAGTKDALQNYWMWGYRPGAFTQAVLENDLYRAAACADYNNKTHLVDLVQWVYFNAPQGSFGSRELVEAWFTDRDGRRTRYAERKEKEYLLKVLAAKPKDFANDPPF